MTLVADLNGVVAGKFRIPDGVLAGSKLVEFIGNAGGYGTANFVGQGTRRTDTSQQVHVVTTHTRYVDPLAQTFTLSALEQIGAVEVFVTGIGDTNFVIQLRETDLGIPTRAVIAEAQRTPGELNINQWNRFLFSTPVTLQPDIEYAVVVMCNDAVGEIAVSELGKWDANSQQWVTSQPYNVGVLLSSANASTWTPHQDKDMALRLLSARYIETSRELDLGTVAVTGATDLLVYSTSEQPDSQAFAELELTLPDGSKVSVSNGQVVRLNAPITGDVSVKSRLHASQRASASLVPGTQIVVGKISTSADYVSRAFPADATGANIRIIFNGLIPSGASVAVYVSGADVGDAWLPVPQDGVAVPIGDGVYEYQYVYADLMEARARVKLVLSGSAAARPYVASLRVSVT